MSSGITKVVTPRRSGACTKGATERSGAYGWWGVSRPVDGVRTPHPQRGCDFLGLRLHSCLFVQEVLNGFDIADWLRPDSQEGSQYRQPNHQNGHHDSCRR